MPDSRTSASREKAETLRRLHIDGPMLVLPNAWDAGSARIFVEAGFKALATTSAGIAFSLGMPDGERISRDEMLAAVARITRRISVPITADLEAGYGATPDAVRETVRRAIDAGAVGMNLEDRMEEKHLIDFAPAVERVRAARNVWVGADARDAGPGTPDGARMEGQGDIRNAGGVRDSIRRAAAAIRLVQLDVQVIGGADVAPGIESHQPEVELHTTVLDDAAARGAEIDRVDPAVGLLVVPGATVGRQTHPPIVLRQAAGIRDQHVAVDQNQGGQRQAQQRMQRSIVVPLRRLLRVNAGHVDQRTPAVEDE